MIYFENFDFESFYDYVIQYMPSQLECEGMSALLDVSESKLILADFLKINDVTDEEIKTVADVFYTTQHSIYPHPNIDRFCRYINGRIEE